MNMDDREIKVFTNSDIIGGGDVEIVTQDRYNEELEIIRLKKGGKKCLKTLDFLFCFMV